MDIIAISGFSEPLSSISHLLAAFGFFIASFGLVFKGRGNNARVIGLLIYSFFAVFLFSMSGVYHLLEKGGNANYVLRVLDYAAIYAMIAGSITPIHLILFRGLHRWLVLVIVWTLSITGLTLTSIFFSEIPHWLSLSFFLGLGWIGLFTIYNIYQLHSRKLVTLMLLGGLFYTVGAVIEFLHWPILIPGVMGPHEIFHLFVILGASFHFMLIYKISEYPISSKITILVKEFPGNRYKAIATSEHAQFEGDSIEDVKSKVLKWIDQEFHHEMKPSMVNFKYSKEENILLE